MGIQARVFDKVGMMDERYFVYYDDTDFVYRCLKQSFQLIYLGNAELRHKVSSSTGGGSSDFSVYYYNRNRLFFIRKNFVGVERFVAHLWYYLTRLYKYINYGSQQRVTLVRALRDGRQMR
jgi:GT2 family glycosyltransferase